MRQKLIEVLKQFGDPVRLQGSLNPEDGYPDSFWTFWVNDIPEAGHYDNVPSGYVWHFWVYYYSIDAEQVETVSLLAKRRLQEAGFTVPGKPVDAASDRKTHTGVMFAVQILEHYKEEV
ncbi:MAG: hypothetical protein RR842_13520 [Gordonibacter sp.]|uniref:hypothetical protein n=1 Tax=Gordonibacter sp. TaxID=1968902 RepID=UPI002FC8FB32